MSQEDLKAKFYARREIVRRVNAPKQEYDILVSLLDFASAESQNDGTESPQQIKDGRFHAFIICMAEYIAGDKRYESRLIDFETTLKTEPINVQSAALNYLNAIERI